MCLEKQNGIFHPNNINHVKILDLAFESAIKMEQWKESLKYGILLIDGYKYVVISIIYQQIQIDVHSLFKSTLFNSILLVILYNYKITNTVYFSYKK